jgi:hypothetical protein
MEWYEFITNYWSELGVSGVLVGQVLYAVWNKIKSKKFAIDFSNLTSLQRLSKDEVMNMSKVVFEQVETFKNELLSLKNEFNEQIDVQVKENTALTNLVVLLASNLNVPVDRKQALYEGLMDISNINDQVKSALKKAIDSDLKAKEKKAVVTKSVNDKIKRLSEV